ncbi:MAG: hypothetical protein II690_03240, partial [Ruminococcus sp.]|nr:hypothetical protein [Ruminococcus sp.]
TVFLKSIGRKFMSPQAASAKLRQLDHFSRCRSLTLLEAGLFSSLNRVFLDTEFTGRIIKRQFYRLS